MMFLHCSQVWKEKPKIKYADVWIHTSRLILCGYGYLQMEKQAHHSVDTKPDILYILAPVTFLTISCYIQKMSFFYLLPFISIFPASIHTSECDVERIVTSFFKSSKL